MKAENLAVGQASVNLMFDSKLLECLIQQGKLHVSDFHCLDNSTKTIVWKMMRTNAARAVRQP